MKTLVAATAFAALFAVAPVLAADNSADNNGKPGSSSNPTPSAKKNSPSGAMDVDGASTDSGANGSSTGTSGVAKDLPGSSNSNKTDSSLSSEGSKPKQQ